MEPYLQSVRRWSQKNVPLLVRLGAVPFSQEAHSDCFHDFGWKVYREDWWPAECCEVLFPVGPPRLLAVYEPADTGVGVALFAIGTEAPFEGYHLPNKTALDDAFERLLPWIEAHTEASPVRHDYGDSSGGGVYRCAYWTLPYAHFLLVQHHEGDVQSGNEATLDIRLLPRLADEAPRLPIETNIIF